MPAIDKKELFETLRARLAETLERLTASHKAVQAGAVHSEAKQEHPKDTRAIEAGYLARGLAERVETLRDGIRALALLSVREFGAGEAAATGALVTIAGEDDRETLYLLAPAGGGERLAHAGGEVLVLTPQSPLGAALAGRRCGDEVEVELPSGKLRAELVRVA